MEQRTETSVQDAIALSDSIKAGRHDKMNYPNVQKIIVLDDDLENIEVDQPSEGEFLVIEGKDAVESGEEVIIISDDSDDIEGNASKEKTSKEESSEDDSNDDSSDDNSDDSSDDNKRGFREY
ncbi:hypothetical protein M0R45_019282 [Rubus argutus]|uniref:Zinc finger protein n=1 Tax=Rubus argutus TaxID=59490 RepID=A0AAW1X6W9_RUBAR